MFYEDVLDIYLLEKKAKVSSSLGSGFADECIYNLKVMSPEAKGILIGMA